jgi:UDP-N-acetylmuramate--alanine ligase
MTLEAPFFFVGISGIGMSGLARVLNSRGVRVAGSSDRRTALTDRLVLEGMDVRIGHAAANLGEARTLVVSSAIGEQNPELVEARRRGLRVLHRGTLLARLMEGTKGIAIAGTHGKTTSSAMISFVLEQAGWAPAWTIGGLRVDCELNARDGNGGWFVAESDESDRSFLELRPSVALISNIENDHVAGDDDFASLVRDFERFAALPGPDGLVCIGTGEPNAAALAKLPRAARTVTFGTEGDYRYAEFAARDLAISFMLLRGEDPLGTLRIPMPGEMNARNATGVAALALELGVPFEAIAAALAEFRGVRRRFDVLLRDDRMTVVDDYAHHPTAIEATIAAARAGGSGPLWVAFQPHRFTRTAYLGVAFARALRGADHVVLTDVYAASEAPIPGVDARTIGLPLARAGASLEYVPDVRHLPDYFIAHAPAGATVLLMGAGSITDAAAGLARSVAALQPAPVRAR